jgi:hypothetical protein
LRRRLSVGIFDLDYTAMKEASGFQAPLFLGLFVFIGMLVSINMFIAILSEYYEKIKNEENQWADDVAIFERQGMTVATTSLTTKCSGMGSFFSLKMKLMIEMEAPNLCMNVRPVQELVAPPDAVKLQSARQQNKKKLLKDIKLRLKSRAVSGSNESAVPEDKRITLEQRLQELAEEFQPANQFENASNLVRLHFQSEFIPSQLDKLSGHRRQNVPIRGMVDGRVFKSLNADSSGDTNSGESKQLVLESPWSQFTSAC